jgi:hypothetical protein
MHLDKESLSIAEDGGDYTVCFRCYTSFKNYQADKIINLIEPILIHKDNWNINSSISFRTDEYDYHSIHLELQQVDMTERVYKGIWSATLVGLDDNVAHNMKISKYTSEKRLKMTFNMSNRMLYLIAMNSIVTFDVKIYLFL